MQFQQETSTTFYLGCAVWAFKDWVGDFYPPKSSASRFLHLYGERMLTVEGNTTFYAVPTPETVQRWARQTPPEFRFCPKLPRTVTHEGPLAAHISEALSFLSLMQGLGDRLGPMMLQLPPSYSPALMSDLMTFLERWPRQQMPIAVEVRHLDWFQPETAAKLNRRLSQLGVGRVLLDSRPVYAWETEGAAGPQRHSQRRKPKVPLQPVVTADFALVRYISHPRLLSNQAYLTGWVNQVADWLSQGKQVYFFVHCPQEIESPAIARYFQTLLEAESVPVPPLPWMHLPEPEEQLTLF